MVDKINKLSVLFFITAILVNLPSHVFSQKLPEPLKFSTYQSMSAEQTIDEICCNSKLEWRTSDKDGLLLISANRAPLWLKIEPLSKPVILEFGAVVDKVELFRVDDDGAPTQVGISGDTILTSKRQIVSSMIAFPISQQEVGKDLYFKIVQDNYVSLDINIVNQQIFYKRDTRTNLVRMGLLGAVLMMVFFNTAVSLVARQIAFLLNAGAIISMLFLDLYTSGAGVVFVWPNSPWISNWILPISIGSAVIFGTMFSISFLQQPGEANLLKKYWFIPVGFATVIVFSGLLLPIWLWMLVLLILIFTLFTGMAGAMMFLAFRGNTRARIFLIPLFLAIMPGFLIYALNRTFGFQLGDYSRHFLEMALCAEALFLSLALSTRLRLAESERSQTASALVNLQRSEGRLMMRAIDLERRRIASDLHDTAGQSMMMISNRLSALKNDFNLNDKLSQRVSEVASFSKETITDIRRISYELHPATIDHLGWQNAVENLFDGLSNSKNVEVDLSIEIAENTLDNTQQIHVYRIIQEIINNIAQHSQAKNCQASITRQASFVKIEIIDDGNFDNSDDVNAAFEEKTMSLGKTIIGYRVQALSGTWEMRQRKQGWIVVINFPIKPKLDA